MSASADSDLSRFLYYGDPTIHFITKELFTQPEPIGNLFEVIPPAYAYRKPDESTKEFDIIQNVVTSTEMVEPTLSIQMVSPSESNDYNLEVLAVDISLHDLVEYKIKPAFGILDKDKTFWILRKKYNPFENIGLSNFHDRAAVKLAAINAVLRFTGHLDGIYEPKILDTDFSFSSVCEGPGAFVQYLQWHLPNSLGYGLTLRVSDKYERLNWNLDILDMKRFNTFYGKSNSANIFEVWEEYSDHVLEKSHGGVDLTTADGGMDGDAGYQEIHSSKIIFYEVLTALLTVKKERPNSGNSQPPVLYGGTSVIKILNTVNKITIDLIFILTRCFNFVYVYKPITSRPLNSERYLVCTKARTREDCQPWINLLLEAEKQYSPDTPHVYISKLLGDLPSSFMNWLRVENDRSFARIKFYSWDMLHDADMGHLYGVSPEHTQIPDMDLEKALLVWSLRSTPFPQKSLCSVSKKKNQDRYDKRLQKHTRPSGQKNNRGGKIPVTDDKRRQITFS